MNAPFSVPSVQTAHGQAATLRFDLRTKDILNLNGRTHEFERRLDGRLQFLRVEDKDVLFLTDEQLAFLSARGEARLVAGNFKYGKPRGPLPNRLKLTKEQVAEAARKLDYVNACIRGFVEGEARPRAPWEFRRSKPALDPVIVRVALSKGEKAPHFTTVLNWFDLWMTLGDIHGKACLVDRHQHKGNRRRPFGHVGEVALERGVWRWLSPNMTTEVAYAKVVTSVGAYKRTLSRHLSPEELDQIRVPSIRTFQRRCKDVDKYVRDYYRKGPEYAAKMHRTYEVQPLPDRPYQDVEVDHCVLDILLVDDDSDVVLGRPDLIIFRCRKTGMIVGASLGYEAPSFASFVAGLRHAMYPKDMSPFPAVRMPWPCFGRIENLWVDNALHFIGKDIEAAARELKMNKPRFKPKCPWLKGALERFFGYLNTGLIHLLPGTTLSNTVKRREPDPETLDCAKIRKSEFEALLMFFICDVHNVHRSKGLGLLRGIGDIPLRVWNEEAARHPSGPLPPVDLFVALCGEWEDRTIQNDGIVWDHVKYECPELITLITNPGHRNAREDGAGTRYRCVRDPSDIGRIYVIDPYDRDGRIITVPATRAHRAYAEGRHRHVHDLAVENARRMVKGAFDFDAMARALDLLGDAAAAARAKPERKAIHRGLARFLDGERKRRFRSEVRTGTPALPATTAGHLDPLAIARRPKAATAPEPGPDPAGSPPAPRLLAAGGHRDASVPAPPQGAMASADGAPGPMPPAPVRDEPEEASSAIVPAPAPEAPIPASGAPGPDDDLDEELAALRADRKWSTGDE
ncbi:putative transposase [Methylobacterium brachiatum]|uniref:Transposase n=1 Tax=Methylobacterium brachiatum TaxID=269660 RepID=A0AAJ1TSX6_9HYPH|nr:MULTISPECIES: Mu transposase C-terminal domain-containing protein [Methylobacterium]MCB4801543.1 Mu transposase C-terminal domain-containing protein [Methylobacterium brachiatum]MCJ2086134.1 Mu transposase C-terminal domain-containing protein [Methylobacterium sp. E-005]MDQ0544249.1 putative transposase [Methylobacterium brachiatum]